MAVSFVLWRELGKLRARVEQLEGETGSRTFEPAQPAPVAERLATLRTPAVAIFSSAPVDSQPPAEPIATFAVESDPTEPALDEPLDAFPPEAGSEPEPEPHSKPRLNFEELFGRRLPIWAGGVTLAVAGFLIVKYSIDSGLLSPIVRMTMGLIFGSALIVAAEAALRGEWFVRDPRVRQSLAGAGIATLYATILMAANIYHLIGPGIAFLAMALVTAVALGLSLRFGAPSAILGLIGGLAAPALVGSGEPDVPLLASYLALTVGGLSAVSRQQRWAWLGAGALIGGFGWGFLLLLGGAMDVGSTISLGILILLLGIVFPLLLLADRGAMPRLAAGLVGCAQMAALVAIGGFSPLHWALFGLISAALIWLSRREEKLRHLLAAGLTVALLLTAAWNTPDRLLLGLVLAGITILYGGAALARLWRDGTLAEAISITAIAVAVLVVPMLHFYRLDGSRDTSFALIALIGATIAAASAALGWRAPARGGDWRFALLVASASALLIAAASLFLPVWAIAPAGALIASALLLFASRASDPRLEIVSWGAAAATIALLLSGTSIVETNRAIGLAAAGSTELAFAIRWLVPAAMAALFARIAVWKERGGIAQPIAVLLVYVALTQLLPSALLPLVPVLLMVALAMAVRPSPVPGLFTAWILTLLWAASPFAIWLAAGLQSLTGDPFLSSALPPLPDILPRLALPAAAILLVVRHAALSARTRQVAIGSAIAFATIAAHSLFKQLFAIDTLPRFDALGYAERTLWQALLAALALLAWQWRARKATIALAGASLAYFACYSLLLHNPLWTEQQYAGAWLVPAYAVPFALLWATKRAHLAPSLDRARDLIVMVLIPLFGLSLLRWAFAGPVLTSAPIGQTEDILRSLLGALIAIGFLQCGIRASLRDWRIASLLLMLATVAKVFLRDASGLDGLVRVASFAALGFSLIGIGWLYSRYLPDPGRQAPTGHDAAV